MATVKVNNKEKKKLLANGPKIRDMQNLLASREMLPKSGKIFGDVEYMIALARKFNDDYGKPMIKKLDRETMKDPNYEDWDFMNKANEYGLFSLIVPKMFGGHGRSLMGVFPMVEELASVSMGLAFGITGHYLGAAALMTSWNIRMMNKLFRDVARGEKTGKPCLFATCITEPEAGTDTEEAALLNKARLSSSVKRVDGGYVFNGKKIFITNGNYATWFMSSFFLDRKHPSDTFILAAVNRNWKGLSIGRHEDKMGQKASPAVEVLYDDVFIPDEYVLFDTNRLSKSMRLSETNKEKLSDMSHRLVDNVVTSTRVGVAANSTGAARGAYEIAREYARTKMVDGIPLINHQWAQTMLAEMLKNVNMSRATYMEGGTAVGVHGIFSIMYQKPVYYAEKFLPKWFFTVFVQPFFNLKLITWLFRKMNFYWIDDERVKLQSAWASIAKVACGDLGVLNSQLAIEFMGIDGCRHDVGAEMHLRDAKLSQIHEGTQQLNRLNTFMGLVSRGMNEARLFE